MKNIILFALSALFLGLGIGIGVTNAIYKHALSKLPSAIDVYRGKTTLQVTYKDSIPIDTTVVFK